MTYDAANTRAGLSGSVTLHVVLPAIAHCGDLQTLLMRPAKHGTVGCPVQ